MKVNVRLDVEADELFHLIMNSLAHDIEMSTGHKVNQDEICEGYEYIKKLTNKIGKQNDALVKISKLDYPYHYEAIFYTSRGENTISYHISKQDLGIYVEYQETYLANKKSKELNHKLMNIFYTKSNRKRAKQLLKNMEEYILLQRDTILT